MAEKKVRFVIERQDSPPRLECCRGVDGNSKKSSDCRWKKSCASRLGMQLSRKSLRRMHDGYQWQSSSGLLRACR